MTVYVLHFDRPYQHARHYLGSCQDLERRFTQHGKGHGARLLAVISAAGITWQLPAPGRVAQSASASSRSKAAEVASVPSARRSARMLSMTRYRDTRSWALWEGGQLLAVTVYKKGAVALMQRLQQMRRRA